MFKGTFRLVGTLLLVLATAMPTWGESPLVAELAAFFTRYHEDPPHLDVLRTGLHKAVATDPDLPNLLALAQACFLWGDIRAATVDQKLEAYDEGREAGQRAVEQAQQNALAHLWFAINTARWARPRGCSARSFSCPR